MVKNLQYNLPYPDKHRPEITPTALIWLKGINNMRLPTVQVDRFYRIWIPLIRFANEELQVVSNLAGEGPSSSIDVAHAVKVRDALWKHEIVLDKFIAKNPARLSPDDLSIAESWKCRRQGQFFIFKELKKHAIFIGQDKLVEVFAVRGLHSSFEEIFGPRLPALVQTVLLPFSNEIITDGLLQSYSLIFGSGIRSMLKKTYDDAKERGAIITTLLSDQKIPARENLAAKAKFTNRKVLDAFIKYQYKAGRSIKTIERDTLNATSFAHFLLTRQPESASLRVFKPEALKSFLMSLPAKERKLISLSIKRFLSFLQDTARLDWDEADDMLDLVKQQEES